MYKKEGETLTTSELKKYISNIYQMEIALYTQRKIYNNIQNKIDKLGQYQGEALLPLKEVREIKSIGQKILYFIGDILMGILGGILGALYGALYSIIPCIIIGIVLAVCTPLTLKQSLMGIAVLGFMLIVIWLILSIFFMATDDKEKKKENEKLQKLNQEITQRNAEKEGFYNRKMALLNQELNIVAQAHTKMSNTLNLYYQRGIIFPKYRNFVAVSSFHEYLSSGRCSRLDGHEGAYNIFESEIRQNMIICKLDEVVRKLDTIQDNQYMMYSAIRQSNQKSDSVLKALDNATDHLQAIESNTTVSAYNSNIIAQNTEFLTWLEILK